MARVVFELPSEFVFSTDVPIYIGHINHGHHLDNAQLLPKVGACTQCPKRTGANPELWDKAGADVCTDTACFADKKEAHYDALKAEAQAKGRKIITGREARELMPTEGATPKDGPSAGVAMCTALVSRLTGNPVRSDVAMTGEITLRGQVLPIGGLKEKLLAAHRGGIKTVLIPYENKRDLEEIPDNVIADLQIHPVKRIEEVLSLALQNEPSGMQVVTAK